MATVRRATCVLIWSMACASQGGPTPAVTPSVDGGAATPRSSADVITLAELDDPALGDADALTIIKRLRPGFLQARGTTSANTPGGGIHVTIDGGPFRTMDALTTIRAHEIREIRYLSVGAAAQVYGSASAASPVIAIRRR